MRRALIGEGRDQQQQQQQQQQPSVSSAPPSPPPSHATQFAVPEAAPKVFSDATSQTDAQGFPKAAAEAAAAAAGGGGEEREFGDMAAAMQHIMQQRQALQVGWD